MNILKGINNFFSEFRDKPDPVKRKWKISFFVFVVVIVMILFIFLRFNTIFNSNQATNEQLDSKVLIAEGDYFGPSFLEILIVGLNNIWQDIVVIWQKLGEGVSWFLVNVYNLILLAIKWLSDTFNKIV